MAALYGSCLRRLRLTAGLTQQALGNLVYVVDSRINQLERGTGAKPTLPLTRKLDGVLNGDGILIELLPHVLRETFPNWSRRFMELSEKATVIRTYAAHLVPGWLQTEDYAREVLRVGRTLESAIQLEERVDARMSRQERLNRPDGPELWAILDESVLWRAIGDEDKVMRDQLEHLLTMAAHPRVTIQVLPFRNGMHQALGGSRTLLTLPDGKEVAYTEGADHGWLVEEREDVGPFAVSYDRLRALALPPRQSVRMIRSVLEDSYCDPRIPSRARRRCVAQVQLQQQGGRRLRRGR
ncbi:helix-turn-helix transcriptional regulator [Streptomyces sp. SB3404]|uniref:Helix-turn-helix transcriptional regulator n=2 Tax=Streptomyces boncukensis TaxID=2711219 RepID=A0A6G4X1C4_9ACTN|nr:helix-turn-helix transcriptional regulator [Streptomyces boncukensis]